MIAARGGWVIAVAATLGGCARPLLGPEVDDAGGADEGGSTGAAEDGTSGDDGGESTTTAAPSPTCHPSYTPCLPLVDDLDCPDVVALGLAPVTVVGEDVYGLDADGDGVGCED